MRKIYSIVLMACAMLISASVFAVDVNTLAGLQEAIDNATEPVEIRLTGDIDIPNGSGYYPIFVHGQNVTLNLNGHNIVAHAKRAIELYSGSLNIIGTGVIEKDSWTGATKSTTSAPNAPNAADAIAVYGSADDVANVSNLTLGENVEIYAHGASAAGEQVNAISVLTTSGSTTNAAWYLNGKANKAFGVNVEIKGKVQGSKYGVKINGTVKTDGTNVPYVHVASTAEVLCAPNSDNSTAIYSSGIGRFLIEGYVHGATGVFVKSGTVTLNDAVVKSDYTKEYNDPEARKNGKGDAVTSGFDGGGSAIVVASQNGYAGGQSVTISGDTKVTGGTGYAIDEEILNGSTKVSNVAVEGGTIEAGGKGAVVITKETSEGDNVITIVGGNIENNVYIKDGTAITPTAVETFTPTGNYSTTEVNDPATGKTTIVVTKLEDGVIIDETGKTIAEAAADEAGLKWTGVSENIEANTTLPYLEINANKPQVVTVKEGVTLTIGRVVMGTQAQIIVKAGARLIVDGEQGIVAPVVSNIVLETSETTPAQFLFNPAVTSNRHPNATVMFTSKAYRKADGSNIYQFFGSPFTAVTSVTASSADYATQLDVWNVNKYDRIGIINYDKVGLPASNAVNYSLFNRTFAFYSMMTNNPQGEEQTYTFKGTLVGNENAELPLYANWAAMSNSYMGTISMDALIEANRARRAEGMQVTLTPYVYSQDGNELHWNANNPLVAGYIKNIAPMQPFMLQNTGDYAEIVNDYADLVWTPATTSAAPARRNIAADMTKATIRVNGNGMSDMVTIAESAEFTAELDELDAVMYPNTDINLYAMAAEKMSVLATDDVENTYIGFACPKGGEFTLTFAGVEGNALTLIDLKNNTAVDMTEGATYTFTAAANEANDYRFQVVGRRNAATALENTDAAVKAEGIYTLTGMYLGNMSVWNTLPAGIYVVNGEKMVK